MKTAGRAPSTSDYPEFSLIVCSRNRATSLKTCLEAIANLEYPSECWEFILVDNGSTDDTCQIFEEFRSTTTIRAQYVCESKKGLSRARNTGLNVANKDIVVFTDDDCYVEPDFLARYADIYKDSEVGFAGGQVRPFSPLTANLSMQTNPEYETFLPTEVFRVGLIHGANMSCRRELAVEVGGFDALLGAGSMLKSSMSVWNLGCGLAQTRTPPLYRQWRGVQFGAD